MPKPSGTRLVNVGHGNVVVAHRIVAIVALDSLPVKRLIESAKPRMAVVPLTIARSTTGLARSAISSGV